MEAVYKFLIVVELLEILAIRLGVGRGLIFGEFVGLVGLALHEAKTNLENSIRFNLLQHAQLLMGSLESFDHPDEFFVLLLALLDYLGVGLLHNYIHNPSINLFP